MRNEEDISIGFNCRNVEAFYIYLHVEGVKTKCGANFHATCTSASHTHTDTHTCTNKQTHCLFWLLSRSLSLSCFTSKVSPPRCRATRTIIIKTKMFKIHFLCFFTHRISAVLVCHLSCASSLSTSYIHTHTHKYLCKRQRAKQLSRLLMHGAHGPSTVAPKQNSCWLNL